MSQNALHTRIGEAMAEAVQQEHDPLTERRDGQHCRQVPPQLPPARAQQPPHRRLRLSCLDAVRAPSCVVIMRAKFARAPSSMLISYCCKCIKPGEQMSLALDGKLCSGAEAAPAAVCWLQRCLQRVCCTG